MRASAIAWLSSGVLILAACGSKPPPEEPKPVEQPVAAQPVAPAAPPAEPAPQEEPPPQEPALPDAAEAGPDAYKTILDNEDVRVFEVSLAGGAKVPLHRHPDHIVYVLKGGKVNITPQDGEPSDYELTKGSGMFIPAGAHATENPGKKEVQVVVVEIKRKGQATPAGDDAVKVAPTMFKQVFDDEHGRILEVNVKKKVKVPANAHPGRVLYVISGDKLQVTIDGATEEKELAPHSATYLPASVHSATNVGKQAIKAIAFDIK